MLVERDTQLAALRSCAASSSGQVVLVAAEAGAGKTTVLRALVDDLARTGARTALVGGCDSLRTARPFGPVVDWGVAADPELAELVRSGSAPARILDRAHALFSRTRPLAIIEDAHWADDATVDLLLFLGRRIAATGAVLVVSYRPDEIQPGSPLALALGDLASSQPVRIGIPALSRKAVVTLAQDRGVDVDADELLDRTGGNAFFVTECLASPEAVPRTVRDAVLARLHRLSPAGVAAAEVVSVFPSRVEHRTATLLGAEPDGVDACLDAGVLETGDGHLGFRHELARIAVTEAMPSSRRRQLHRRALSQLERESPVDEARAVHHALEAGDTAAVVRHAQPAADQAEAMGARREAIAHLELAIRVGGSLDVDARRALLARIARLSDETGDFARAVSSYDAARSLTEDPRAAAMLLVRSWSPLTMGGDPGEASVRLDEAIDQLERLPPGPELALAYAQRCSLHMLARRLREAEVWGDRALALAAASDERDTLAYAQIQSGAALFMSGDPAGFDRVRAGIEAARGHGAQHLVAHGLSQIGSGGGEIRAYRVAVPALQECIDYADRHELHSRGLYSRAWLGRCQVELCQWPEATSTLTGVLKSARATGVTRLTALAALGRLRARRGDPDPWGLLDEALDLARRTGHLQRLWPVAAARAEAAWLARVLDQEVELLTEVLDLARGLDQPWARGELAMWTRRAGAPGRPEDEDAAAAPYALMLAGRARDAARSWQALGCEYDAADALSQSPDDADQLEALSVWKSLGAAPAAALLTDQRRVAGRPVPRGPNAATLGNAAGLTSREVEVLELLVEGLRNPEIAERMHLSAKTVGHHVSHILGKLGVANRTEAVRAAMDRGVLSAERVER